MRGERRTIMRIKGWILTVVASVLWLIVGAAAVFMRNNPQYLEGQPELRVWTWVNLGVLLLLFAYGVKRGVQLLRFFCIPPSRLKRAPGTVVCEYTLSLKQYAMYKLWDVHHFSFSLLLALYAALSLCVGYYVMPERHGLFIPLLIWFLCLFYMLVALPIRLNQLYRKRMAGHTWVELTPDGILFDRSGRKEQVDWQEIRGVALYRKYVYLYGRQGKEYLVVTADEQVRQALLYYLNLPNKGA